MGTRTNQSIKNAIVAIIAYSTTTLLTFVSRTVFIRFLTDEYLGLNGLFSNILFFLSLAELGIGSAMNYALYKPIKDNNVEKIKSYMALYKKLYCTIGCIILILGLSLTPFLEYLIKDFPQDMPLIYVYFIIYVFNSGISYFCIYKRSLIVCDQKEYIATMISMIFGLFVKVAQIIVIWLTHSYLLYLLIQSVLTIGENMVISVIANRMYPYLKDKDHLLLEQQEIDNVKKNVFALVFHKIGSTIVFATDNIIISKFINLITVGLYSNYTIISSALHSIVEKIFNSIIAGVGDLVISADKEYVERVFNRILFINIALYGFCSICLFSLVQPFIRIWVGDEYLLELAVVAVCVLNFYLTGARKTIWIFKSATGNFYPDRYRPLIEGLANLILSILLVKKIGLVGVLIGTTITTVCISFWCEAWIVFKYYFKKTVFLYLARQFLYLLEIIVGSVLSYWIIIIIPFNGLLGFLLKVAVCVFISIAYMIAIWHRKEEFRYVVGLLKRILMRLLRRKEKIGE